MKTRNWKAISLVLASALVAVGATVAIGLPGTSPTTKLTGKAVTAVSTASKGTATTVKSTSPGAYVPIGGAAVKVTVPKGKSVLVVASFSATSKCEGGAGGSTPDECRVRLVANTKELLPAGQIAFDTSGNDGTEAHSIERSLLLKTGKYTVKAEGATTGAATLTLDGFHLTVEQVATKTTKTTTTGTEKPSTTKPTTPGP